MALPFCKSNSSMMFACDNVPITTLNTIKKLSINIIPVFQLISTVSNMGLSSESKRKIMKFNVCVIALPTNYLNTGCISI